MKADKYNYNAHNSALNGHRMIQDESRFIEGDDVDSDVIIRNKIFIDHVGDELSDKFFKLQNSLESPYNSIEYWLDKPEVELYNFINELAEDSRIKNYYKIDKLSSEEDLYESQENEGQELDSDGNQLSIEQVSFFKNSKIRDSSGKLLVCYHGTNVDFTEFKKERNDGSRTRIQSFWFTSNNDVAYTYHNNSGRILAGYLNIENPFIYDAKGCTWSKIEVDNALLDLLKKTNSSYYNSKGTLFTSTNDILNAIYTNGGYDGIIFKNIKDFGPYLKVGRKINYNVNSDDYIIFNSNQFKLISNKNPTSSSNINEEFDLLNSEQEYTSANTSINSAKLPAIFSMVSFKPETINLDYGGGKFDNATNELSNKGVTNLIYDPYNRSAGHNKSVIDAIIKNGGADTATCSNVLNVIKEPEAREAVIKNIYKLLKDNGVAYFTVYEGTGKGNEGPTKSGYQLNRKTSEYIDEISSVFPNVKRKGKLIIANKSNSLTESDHTERAIDNGDLLENTVKSSKSSDLDIISMIEEAIDRGVTPEDIFEKPFDKVVDANWFLTELTKDSSEDYIEKAFTRIIKNNKNNEFYRVLLDYLNSLETGNTNYKKLEPASYKEEAGQVIPLDGRHRAQLCVLLEIDLPIRLYHNNLTEAEDIGYHYGDLGKADFKHEFGNRNSGGFGTGTYFVGTPVSQRDDAGSYRNRPEHKIDVSKYNLYRPRTNEQAYQLHNALLALNNMSVGLQDVPKTADEIFDEYDKVREEYYAPLNALDPDDYTTSVKLDKKILLKYIRKYIEYYPYKLEKGDDLLEITNTIFKNLLDEASKFTDIVHRLDKALDYRYSFDKLRKIAVNALKDSSDIAPSTLIMQALGYDGVDTRHLNKDAQGLSGLDNFGFGSVIYDLKESITDDKTDSNGKTLSDSQIAYFKGSKVRDSSGRLLPVYHGTKDNFTVFKHGHMNRKR